MSFYQPSLSLYDVLNALSNQGQRRNPDDQLQSLQRRHAEAEAQRRAERAAARRSPFLGRFEGSPAAFYGIPSEHYYYRPDEYDYSDDEQELVADDDENQEQTSGIEAPYLRVPSYYHSRAPRGYESGSANVQSDPLQELLGALLGAPQREGETSQPEEEIRKALGVEQPEENAQEVPGAPKSDAVPESTKPEAETQPASKKKPSLHSRPSAPNPLKVSKPESRLDVPFSPEVNVYDCPTAYVAVVALPGATSKAFKVDYHPSSHELIIKGNIEDKLNIGEEFLKITELKYGAFQRTVKFPVLPRIKDEEIKATYSNGLLQVKVPKLNGENSKPAPKKRIVIEDIPDEELRFEENPNPVQG